MAAEKVTKAAPTAPNADKKRAIETAMAHPMASASRLKASESRPGIGMAISKRKQAATATIDNKLENTARVLKSAGE